MKKKLTTALATLLLLTMSFALMACGKPSLDDWYAKNEDQFTAVEEQLNNMDMGVTVEIIVENGVLAYRYTLTEALDTSDPETVSALADVYDSMFDQQAATFSELRTQVLNETSAEDVTIRLEVLNLDGSELYTRDFTE